MKGRGLLTIRVSKNTLSFTTLDTTNLDEPIVYEPYTIKSGISMAANLREAFKETTAVSRTAKAQVLLDAKVLMIPIEQFQESDIEKYYFHTFPQDNQLSVRHQQGRTPCASRQRTWSCGNTSDVTSMALSPHKEFHRSSPEALRIFPRQATGDLLIPAEQIQVL